MAGLFLTLGCLFLAGLAVEYVGRRTRLPRVSLLIALGIVVGPPGFDLLPGLAAEWHEPLTVIALTMVAFLLGGALTRQDLQRQGRAILMISAAIVLVTLGCVATGLYLIGTSPALALLLAGIATATDPAATRDVIVQTGAKGDFPDTLTGIVAIDDAWGLLAFALVMLAAGALTGESAADVIPAAAWELGGALTLGAALGLPAAYLTGRVRPGEPLQMEALAVVFLCAGAAERLGVSPLIAGMTAGALVANLARHHVRPFREIEHIQWPFMLLFFVLAGAALDVAQLAAIGGTGAAFILLRVLGRALGGWSGAALASVPRSYRAWIGPALLPQAGVAVGMALLAGRHFPDLAATLVTLTVGTTVVFELAGPLATALALRRVAAAGPPQKPWRS